MTSTSFTSNSSSVQAGLDVTGLNTVTVAAPVQPTINSNHPLFLYPSDTSGRSLISEKLTGSDSYAFCSHTLYIFLLAPNNLSFIYVNCVKENLEPSWHQIWERCNAFVFAWIMTSVSHELMNGIVYSTMFFKYGRIYVKDSIRSLGIVSFRYTMISPWHIIYEFFFFKTSSHVEWIWCHL